MRLLALIVIACCARFTPAAEAPPDLAAQDARIARSLEGRWAGMLIYRDYQSDEWVQLPASVVCESIGSAPMVARRVGIYETGRTIESTGLIALNAGTYIDIDVSDAAGETYTIESRRFDDTFDWELVMLAEGTDNGEPADVRLTMTMKGDSLSQVREVRPADADTRDAWTVRNRFKMDRKAGDAADLVGEWEIDLRPAASAEPYTVRMKITQTEGGDLIGTFYNGSEIVGGRVSAAWGAVRFAFTTSDGSGEYHTSGTLRDGRIEGMTLSVGRGFLMPWWGERVAK